VIFVDLSLAQIAALGATIALLLPVSGGDPHAPVVYWSQPGVHLPRRARLFDHSEQARAHSAGSDHRHLLCRGVGRRDPGNEQATSESEHLKDMLVGNILAVSWPEVTKTALLYGAIGTFHYIFRKQFLAISMSPERAEAQGLSVKFWDFLFYASFGFVVTSSVSIAGVLLVFCYLIVPSVAAMLYSDSIGKRLAIGWSMGTTRVRARRVSVAQARSPTGARLCVRSVWC